MIFFRKRVKSVPVPERFDVDNSYTDDLAWKFAMEQILIDKNICTYDEIEKMKLRKPSSIDQWTQKEKDEKRLAARRSDND